LGLADEMLLEHGEIKKLDPIQALIDWDAIEKHLAGIQAPGQPRLSAPENTQSLIATGVGSATPKWKRV